jgi:hypothetical protein
MLRNKIIKVYMMATIGLVCFACTDKPSIILNETVTEDTEYAKVYGESTVSGEIYKDFESRFRVTATYLSPKFRTAFSNRLKELFTQDHPGLDEAGQKAGFFISIQSPDDNSIDLNDPHLWSIFLDLGEGRTNPSLVKRVYQKERWTPFFKDISHWSREYLIVFDAAAVTPNSPDMVQKASVALTFANSDAKVRLNW